MPRVKKTPPTLTKQKNQRSIALPDYLYRILPQWQNPEWLAGEVWRRVVRQQPFAMDCRDFIISSLTSLEWKTEPRDSTKRDEYKEEIEYYTDFFEQPCWLDYYGFIEFILGDALDLPFGNGS